MPRIGVPRTGQAEWDWPFLRRRLVVISIALAIAFLFAVAYKNPPRLKSKKPVVTGAALGLESGTGRPILDAGKMAQTLPVALAAASHCATPQARAATSSALPRSIPAPAAVSSLPQPTGTAILTPIESPAWPGLPETDLRLHTWPREARICDATRCTGVRRVFSFSLFGAGSNEYSRGMVANARLMRDLMPDWECWVFLPGAGGEPRDRVDDATVAALEAAGARLVYFEPSAEKVLGYGMKQRFLVSGDPSIDRFAVRDSDARLLLRDREVEDEFEASGMRFHVVYDNHNHGNSPGTVLGGAWCAWGLLRRDSRLAEAVVVELMLLPSLAPCRHVGRYTSGRLEYVGNAQRVGARAPEHAAEGGARRFRQQEGVSRLAHLPPPSAAAGHDLSHAVPLAAPLERGASGSSALLLPLR